MLLLAENAAAVPVADSVATGRALGKPPDLNKFASRPAGAQYMTIGLGLFTDVSQLALAVG